MRRISSGSLIAALAVLLSGCVSDEGRRSTLTPVRDASGRIVGYVQQVPGRVIVRGTDMTTKATVQEDESGRIVVRDVDLPKRR